MISFVVGFALLLHLVFWGAGLATLIMPHPWRRFWPVAILPAAVALQSAVVWLGAYADLPGTNAYAWPTEVIPAALLALGIWRHGWAAWKLDVSRFGLVWAGMAVALALLLLPMALASRGLTTLSLGSCDAADYAAGARTFMEFARSDRSGFLGLTEVVQVASADNFYDFWLRLNHFTPSALIALNGSILDCAPHELTGILTAVVLAGTLPLVFWLSRTLFGYSGIASLVICGVYGISPITWYSYAHVSPAPLIAANALGLLTWAGIALWRGALTWHHARQFAGILCVAYAIVLGAYNFILIVALVPAVAYAGGLTLFRGTFGAGGPPAVHPNPTDRRTVPMDRGRPARMWARFARWLLALLLPLAAAGFLFWDRVDGLVERFMLFQTYDFGWPIPAFGPEGWLGLVQGGDLAPWWWPLRWLLAVMMISLWSWALWRSFKRGRRQGWMVVAVTVPILIGYAYLELRGMLRGTNASYDAFKLFAVFYPVLLPAFCWWENLRWAPRLIEYLLVLGFAALVVGFNLLACVMSVWALSRPTFLVDGELRQLRKVEAMSDVASVNMLVPDMWSRLWANVFLLRKPQYFPTHTYEGRLNTPLRGEWDLVSGPVRIETGSGTRGLTTHRWLSDTRAPGFLRAELSAGWHPEEHARDGDRWTWTLGEAHLELSNPGTQPVTVGVQLDGRAFAAQDVSITVQGEPPRWSPVGVERGSYPFPPVTVPPGHSTLVLRCRNGASAPPGDRRELGLCVFRLTLIPGD